MRAVGIDDLMQVGRRDDAVERLVVADGRRRLAEPFVQQGPHDRVVARPRIGGPARLVEVAIHQELAEREEPEHDRAAVDLPPLLVAHRQGHGVEEALGGLGRVGIGLGIGELGQVDAEVGAELGDEREVDLGVFFAGAEPEPLAGARPLELDRHEQQRRAQRPLPLAVVGLEPAEHSRHEEERVDPLLLERRPRRVEDRQQPRLQAVGGQVGLQLEVGLAWC